MWGHKEEDVLYVMGWLFVLKRKLWFKLVLHMQIKYNQSQKAKSVEVNGYENFITLFISFSSYAQANFIYYYCI